MEKNSIDRLNKFKIETNRLAIDIEEKTHYLNQIKSEYIEVSSIVKSYQNKIFEIAQRLEKQGIDFWSNDFELREAILDYLSTELYYGSVILCYIDIKILNNKLKKMTNKKISLPKILKILPEIEKVNKTCQTIKEYDLNKDLEDTLMKHFIIVSEDDEVMRLNESYEKMKQNIDALGLDQVSPGIEDFIKTVIKEKKDFVAEKQKKSFQRTR